MNRKACQFKLACEARGVLREQIQEPLYASPTLDLPQMVSSAERRLGLIWNHVCKCTGMSQTTTELSVAHLGWHAGGVLLSTSLHKLHAAEGLSNSNRCSM